MHDALRPSSKTHEPDDECLSSRHGILHCEPRYPKLCLDGPDDLARGNATQNSLEAACQGFADELRFDDLLWRPDEPDDEEHQAATLASSEDRQRLNSMSVVLSGWFPQRAILYRTLIRRGGMCAAVSPPNRCKTSISFSVSTRPCVPSILMQIAQYNRSNE